MNKRNYRKLYVNKCKMYNHLLEESINQNTEHSAYTEITYRKDRMNELTTINVPELNAIEQSKAAQIAAAFSPLSARLGEFEEDFNEIVSEYSTGVTEDLTKKAKRLRLDIGKIRIETGKIKDKQKENIKLEDKAIMGVHNWIVLAVKEKEDRLSEIETHFERIQEEKRRKLQLEREAMLSQYTEDVSNRDLASMDEEVWSAFISTKEREYNERIEAEKKAEAKRIENARLDELYRIRFNTILPYRQFWETNEYNLRIMPDNEFDGLVNDLQQAKTEYEEEQKRIREENERLAKEKAEIERKAAEERVKAEKASKQAEEKARKEREKIERERAEERRIAAEKQAKIEAELKAKQEAEEKAAREKAEAERKAANAPDKEKIKVFINLLSSIQYPTVGNDAQTVLEHAKCKINALCAELKGMAARL